MPLPITTRFSRRSAIMFMCGCPLDTRSGESAHFTAPARPHRENAGKSDQRHGGEDREAESVAAGELLGVTQAGGEIEAAKAAGHADQAGHQADILAEALRHQLEDGAIAH